MVKIPSKQTTLPIAGVLVILLYCTFTLSSIALFPRAVNPLKTWLREHVHKLGSVYSPKELQRRLFGEAYNPQPLLKYLEDKYLA